MADSIVKDIYSDIKTALADITAIGANVDLFKNQITGLTTSPYVLIDFPYIYYKEASARIQLGHTMIRVILCIDVEDLAGADATDVFEIKDEIYAALQGVRKPTSPPVDVKYAPLTRGTERTETKYIDEDTNTGIYVFEMDFYTTIQDDGVYRLKNFVNANDPAVNENLDLEDEDLTNDHVQLEIVKGNVRELAEIPEGQGTIGLIIDNLAEDKHNGIRTGKLIIEEEEEEEDE